MIPDPNPPFARVGPDQPPEGGRYYPFAPFAGIAAGGTSQFESSGVPPYGNEFDPQNWVGPPYQPYFPDELNSPAVLSEDTETVIRAILDLQLVWPAVPVGFVRLTRVRGGDVAESLILTFEDDQTQVTFDSSTAQGGDGTDRVTWMSVAGKTLIRVVRVNPTLLALPDWDGALRLDPSTYAASGARVTSLTVGDNRYDGVVRFRAGSRATVGADDQTVTLGFSSSGVPDPSCADQGVAIRTINLVGPAPGGNFSVETDLCMSWDVPAAGTGGLPVVPATLPGPTVDNSCGPRCPGANYQAMRLAFRLTAAGLNALANRLLAVAARYEALRATWRAQQPNPLRVIVNPELGCRVGIGFGWVNRSPVVVPAVQLRIQLTGADVTLTPSLCGGDSVTVVRTKPGQPPTETTFVPSFSSGVWVIPVGDLKPGQGAGVRMRVRLSRPLGARCLSGDAVAVVATVAAPAVVGGPPFLTGVPQLGGPPVVAHAEVATATIADNTCGC